MRTWKTKKEFKKLFIEKAEVLFEKSVKELSHKEVYQIIATMIKDLVSDDWIQTEKIYNHKRVRQVYYSPKTSGVTMKSLYAFPVF